MPDLRKHTDARYVSSVSYSISSAHGLCQFYEVRFPRISKVYRPSERSALESGDGGGTTLQELQSLARESVGKDKPGKSEIDFCKTIWGSGLLSPGVRSNVKRKQREDEWVDKLRIVDEKALGRKVKRPRPEAQSSNTGHNQGENEDENKVLELQRHAARPGTTMGLRAMSSVTNLDARTPSPPPITLGTSRLKRPPTPSGSTIPENSVKRSLISDNPVESRLLSPANSQHGLQRVDTVPDITSLTDENPLSDAMKKTQLDISEVPIDTRGPSTTQTPLVRFLQDAVVWLARPADSPRPRWRAPSHQVISRGQQVHTMESLLAACDWTSEGHPASVCEWATKGVVFVDDQDGNTQWTQFPLGPLLDRRQDQVDIVTRGKHDTNQKPIFIFSLSILSRELLDIDIPDIGSLALCRLG